MRRTYAVAAVLACTALACPQLARATPATPAPRTGTTTTGTESHPAPLYGYSAKRVTRRVQTDQRIIALTLDDGFNLDPRMLDLVQTWGLRGTAFIVGQVARDNPAFVHRLVDLGWEVCSHTWDHKRLTELTDYQIYREMYRGMREVNKVSGQHCPYFRPPYGAVDSRVVYTADHLGLKLINWDASLSDSTKPGADPRVQIDLAFKYLHPGSILLGHWGAVNSYEVLKAVLTGVLGAGYHVGTVTELLEAGGETPPAAALAPATAPTDGSPTPVPVVRALPSTLAADDASVPVLHSTANGSGRMGLLRIVGPVAGLLALLGALRARAGRRRRRKSAEKDLAPERQREYSAQRN